MIISNRMRKKISGEAAMKQQNTRRRGEEGFVMVASLLILLVLTMLGIAVNRNTDIEWRIAMNDRLHKQTFYAADATTELASEALEQSIACLGFRKNATDTDGGEMMIMGGYPTLKDSRYNLAVEGNSLGFWRNYAPKGVVMPGEGKTERNMVYPAAMTSDGKFDRAATTNQDHANINIGGNTGMTKGAALQMAAGYEGLGKGMGGGGATLTYTINVRQVGREGSESTICVQYNHVLGSSGKCNY